jgi:hypothetical protein
MVQEAQEQFVAMLADDDVLIPMYRTAAVKLKPERFERNFASLLESYADDLSKEATNNLQKAAVHLIRSRRKHAAKAIRRMFFPSNEEQNHVMDEFLLQKVDRSMKLDNYLARYQHDQVLESADEADELLISQREVDDSNSDFNSDSSVGEDTDIPNLPNLDHVRVFMITGSALSNLRDRFRSFFAPQPPNKGKPERGERLDAPRGSIHSNKDRNIARPTTTSTSSRISAGDVLSDSSVDSHILDIPKLSKDDEGPRDNSKTVAPEATAPLDFNSEPETQIYREPLQYGSTQIPLPLLRISHTISRLVAAIFLWPHAVLPYTTDFFAGTAPPLEMARLTWTCVSDQAH